MARDTATMLVRIDREDWDEHVADCIGAACCGCCLDGAEPVSPLTRLLELVEQLGAKGVVRFTTDGEVHEVRDAGYNGGGDAITVDHLERLMQSDYVQGAVQ